MASWRQTMILKHLVGLYLSPKQEWHKIDDHHESTLSAFVHAGIMGLIPPVSAFISSTQIGWFIGAGDPIFLKEPQALLLSIFMYFVLIAGVLALAYLTFWMSRTFGSNANYTQALEISAYTATPVFMVGLAAFYPVLWVVILIGLAGVAYSVYLLYIGLPIIMHIPKEQGFIYASCVVTCALVLFVSILTSSVILLNIGFEFLSL